MKDIYIVSDVHLDYIVGEQNTIYKNFLNMFEKDKTYFIAGDIYDNLEKTLRFLSDMEKNEINCYFVLGNHEFHELRHAPTMANFHGWDSFVKKAIKFTQKFKYVHFLHTSNVLEWNGYKIVGDTAWTNFKINKKLIDVKKFKKDFPTSIRSGNYKWNIKQNVALENKINETIKNNDKVIVLTHFPLYIPDISIVDKSERIYPALNSDLITFYYSDNDIKVAKNKHVYFIHGHTHGKAYQENHFTNAIGREGKNITIEKLSIV